ncbi:MAG: J domain-containing protein, partial [Trebonia sp.]
MTNWFPHRGAGWGPRLSSPGAPEDPFAVLGLPAHSDLTDEDVRAAWRRIAAVTHPDLEDGGDPARFSAAAAAYDALRTS